MMQEIVTHLIVFVVGGLLGVLLMAMLAVAEEHGRDPFSELS